MTKYEIAMNKALEELNNNDELFVELINELDSWNGFADGYRGFPMWEIDELFCDTKVSEFLDKLAPGFNHNDAYFIDTIWGIDSTNDLASYYRENTDAGDVLDSVIEYRNHLWIDPEFEELLNEIEEAREAV